LDDAPIVRGAASKAGRNLEGVDAGAVRRQSASGEQILVGGKTDDVGVVENVEGFTDQLELDAFGDIHVLGDARIDAVEIGHGQRIAAHSRNTLVSDDAVSVEIRVDGRSGREGSECNSRPL